MMRGRKRISAQPRTHKGGSAKLNSLSEKKISVEHMDMSLNKEDDLELFMKTFQVKSSKGKGKRHQGGNIMPSARTPLM